MQNSSKKFHFVKIISFWSRLINKKLINNKPIIMFLKGIKRIAPLVTLFLITSVVLFAQKGERDHVITWTPTSLAFTKIGLGYEYTLNEKIGLRLGIGWSYVTPGLIDSEFSNSNDAALFGEPDFDGLDITPELRFYPGGKAAEKFFIGPFLRYYKYGINNLAFDFEDGGGVDRTGEGDFNVNGFGGGIVLGGQWIANNGFVFGIHTGFGYAVAKFSGEVRNVSGVEPEEYKGLEQDLIDELNDIGANGEDNTIFDANDFGTYSTSNSVGMDSPNFPAPIIRFGLSIGYAF